MRTSRSRSRDLAPGNSFCLTGGLLLGLATLCLAHVQNLIQRNLHISSDLMASSSVFFRTSRSRRVWQLANTPWGSFLGNAGNLWSRSVCKGVWSRGSKICTSKLAWWECDWDSDNALGENFRWSIPIGHGHWALAVAAPAALCLAIFTCITMDNCVACSFQPDSLVLKYPNLSLQINS